jgi:GNAT superfamily N-acetyltransferase
VDTLTIAEADSDEALADWVAVRNRAVPESPTTVEETRFFSALDRGRTNLLARRGGVAVGSAFCCPVTTQPDSLDGEAAVRIPTEIVGQGVWEALFAACCTGLSQLDKDAMRIGVREDEEAALRFLEARGFTEISRNQLVVLDLATLPEGQASLPDAVSIVSLADRPDLLHGAWEVDCEITPDIPGPEERLSWEQFQTLLSKPGMDHRLCLVAVAGEQVVGVAVLALNAADPSLALNWVTGVRRAWRRRGIAGALKDRQLSAARALGVRQVRTMNELRNEPIRRLNDRLGYRREPDHIIRRGPLVEPAGR